MLDGFGIGNLFRLSDMVSRSISPENPTGAPHMGAMAVPGAEVNHGAAARDLGVGWKVRPFIAIEPGEVVTLADIAGSGAIQHIWMTLGGGRRRDRDQILRFYWDDCQTPSVECPVGDFFASGWQAYAQVSSLAVCANPASGYNCYWPMPFKEHCVITIENRGETQVTLYYQIDYALGAVPSDMGYFHAAFNRSNPVPYKQVHTLLDGISGRGQYVGTYIAWGVNNNGWWGEGEIKFYMDGDAEYPTICGTGTEDYFCGSYNFDVGGRYTEYTTPYSGLCQVLRPDGLYNSQQRFGMYRWHIADPITFRESLRVTIQDLGWRGGGRFLAQQSDISSVSYWYLAEPATWRKALQDRETLEFI